MFLCDNCSACKYWGKNNKTHKVKCPSAFKKRSGFLIVKYSSCLSVSLFLSKDRKRQTESVLKKTKHKATYLKKPFEGSVLVVLFSEKVHVWQKIYIYIKCLNKPKNEWNLSDTKSRFHTLGISHDILGPIYGRMCRKLVQRVKGIHRWSEEKASQHICTYIHTVN